MPVGGAGNGLTTATGAGELTFGRLWLLRAVPAVVLRVALDLGFAVGASTVTGGNEFDGRSAGAAACAKAIPPMPMLIALDAAPRKAMRFNSS